MLTIWYNARLSSKKSHSSGARFCLSANLSSLHQGFNILTIWYNTRLSSKLPTQVVQGSAYITFCVLSAKLSSLHQGFNMLTLWYNTRLYSKLPTQVVQGGFGGGLAYIYIVFFQCILFRLLDMSSVFLFHVFFFHFRFCSTNTVPEPPSQN